MNPRQQRGIYVALGAAAVLILIITASSRPQIPDYSDDSTFVVSPSRVSNEFNFVEPVEVINHSQNIPIPSSNEHLQFSKAVDNYRTCISKKYNDVKSNVTALWVRGLQNIVKECLSNTDINKIVISPLENNDEIKHHIYSSYEEPSTIVTLGVGADTKVEQHLKEKLPTGSEFYAADPIYEPNAKMFEPIGTFFPFAVGSHTGISKANIRKDDGRYASHLMTHIDVETFFGKLVNRTKIDHLLLDNEGPEYEIIPMLAKGSIFDDLGVTVCQMNVEVHDAAFNIPTKLIRQKFIQIMDRILDDARYVPLISEYYGHQRMYFVNVESDFCVNKYLMQFFTEK